MKFSRLGGVVLDMDGVLWRGSQPLLAMDILFEWLYESEMPFVLATNNSSRTRSDYVQKLADFGVQVTQERIVTSATATAAYLQTEYPAGARIHVVGMHGLRTILDEAGFDIRDDEGQPPELVVAGMDFELTYNKLSVASTHLFNGARFIGTNPDLTFPTPDGLVPGTGSILAALEAATGQKPFVIGKPHAPMFEMAMQILGTSPQETLMVGDRLNTDIEGGKAVGMPTALLLTGVTTQEQLTQSSIWPDVAYEGLPELLKAWAGDAWYLKVKRGRA